MKKQFLHAGSVILVMFVVLGFSIAAYGQYNETFKVTASDGSAGDILGNRVAISGDYAIVSAPGKFIPASGSYNPLGKVYFFEKGPGVTWSEVNSFTPAYLYVPETNLGVAVAIDGTLAVAGAYYLDNSQDAVYVYQRAGGTWNHLIRLYQPVKGFGNDVDVSGNYVIVGAAVGGAGDAFGRGRAFIYEYNGDPGFAGWSEVTELAGSDAPAAHFFGSSVAISGNYAAVSASGDINDQTGQAVFLFERTAPGVWTEIQKLESPASSLTDAFGIQLAMEGNTLVVSAPNALVGGISTGAAYIYERNGSGVWNLSSTLTPYDGALYDSYGSKVDIESDRIIVGSRNDDDDGDASGAAYIYERSGSSWPLVGKWTASDAASGDQFGIDVGITPNYAVVGALGDDDLGSASGSAYFLQHEITIPPISPILIIRIFPNPNYGKFIFAAAEILSGQNQQERKADANNKSAAQDNDELLKVDTKTLKASSTNKIIKSSGILTVANEKGEVLIERKIELPAVNTMDLKRYGPGLYFLTVETKDNKRTVRVLVKEQ